MRWMPPAYSPLHWRDLADACAASASARAEARHVLMTRYDAEAVLLCDSGTSALTLAVRLGASGHAGPIAIPAYACFDIATAVAHGANRLLPYDIDPHTLAPDPESLERALRAGARRVIVAPLYGVPLDWDAVAAQCAAAGALLIEDAAQGSGAEWRGTPHGSLGDLTVLSFGRGKGRTATGGGALLVRRASMGAAMRKLDAELRPSGRGRMVASTRLIAQLMFSSPRCFGLVAGMPGLGVGETRFRVPTAPRTISAAQAALLSSALTREAHEVDIRRAYATRWMAALPPAVSTPALADGARAGYLRFPILRARAQTLQLAERRLGIGPAYPSVLADLPAVLARCDSKTTERLCGAREIVARLVTLPTHSRLAPRDAIAVIRWLERQR